MKKFLTMVVLTLLTFVAISDTNFRVMSYNTLNFDGSDRISYFETVFAGAQPDILITQEISSEAAADSILAALNSVIGGFSRANFVYDGDLNNMLFYKTSLASLVSQDVIDTSPRDISEYVLNIDGNQVRFYSCHLKSSEGTENEQERLDAVTALRNHLNDLPAGTEFVVVGDMNFYADSEPGYQKFIADEADNDGRSEDVCTQVGSWHNNVSFASVHTQASRYEQFGGGASGGLDDKFDFIFAKYGMNDGSGIEYSTGSFTSYGNDGNHYNQSVNDGSNSAVSDSVADALYYASDHLPVYADFSSVGTTQTYLIISEYVEGSSYNKAIEIYNGTGADVDLSAYSLEKDVNGDEVWGNTYNFSGTLSSGDVFVLANSQADSTILAVADDTDNGVINFNGDDEIRLLKYGSEIDRIGIPGDIDFGKDVTYVRKSTVTDPQSGPQDPRSNGEWDSYPQDTFSYLGFHNAINPTLTIIAPNGSEEWERGNSYNITWTSSDFSGNVKIELYKQSSGTYTELVSSTANDSLWEWNIPADQTIASDYKIKISDASDGTPFDESDDFFSVTGSQTYSDLLISEYIEGSSNNKYLEIYNGTEGDIDLSSYSVKIYANGNTAPTSTISLSGTLASGDVFVIANSSATAWSGTPDLSSGSLNFNGDDAVALEGASGNVDVIGQIGVQQVWGSGDVTTQNHTLRRKTSVTEGDSDGSDAFDPTIEWEGYAQDNVDDLGSYGTVENNPPTISNVTGNPENPTASDSVYVSADISDSDGTITSASVFWGTDGTNFPNEINMSVSGRATYTSDTPIPPQSQGTTVYYYVEATDDDDATTTSATDSYTIPNIYTIYEIQGQADSSPLENEIVTTSGIVTGVASSGYFLQDGSGEWRGIFVYDTNTPSVGDSLTISGTVAEYYNKTEIKNITDFTVNSSGNNLPAAIADSTGNISQEKYEGVLISISNAECTDDSLGYGEWMVNDGSGDCRIDDMMYHFTPTLGTNYDVTGIVDYAYGNYKVEPRDSSDVSVSNTQLPAPENLTISVSGNDVILSWDTVSGASSYHIYRSQNPYDFNSADEFTSTTNSYTDSGAATNQKYFYQVTAE